MNLASRAAKMTAESKNSRTAPHNMNIVSGSKSRSEASAQAANVAAKKASVFRGPLKGGC